MSLREDIIRLAHANPELQPHLLPILKEAQDANQTYAKTIQKIHRNMQHITERLGAHQTQQRQQPRDWSYVGDLEHVAKLLDEIVDFLR